MMTDTPDRILRINTVLERTGLSRSTLYRKVQTGTFPEQVKIALGAPDRVLTRTGTDGQSEIWVYRDANPRFGLGFGIGICGGSSSVGGGVGVGTGGAEFADEHMRVIFTAGRVSAVEQSAK